MALGDKVVLVVLEDKVVQVALEVLMVAQVSKTTEGMELLEEEAETEDPEELLVVEVAARVSVS